MGWYSKVSHFASEQLASLRPGEMTAFPQFEAEPGNGEAQHGATRLVPIPHIPSGLVGLAQGGRLVSPLTRGGIERVYTAFDVSQPVENADDLRGRDVEVGALLSGVLYRRTHGLVAGPRGSGKTSLVRVFGQYADREGIVVLYSACDDGTTFGELLRSYLEQIPASSLDADDVESFEQRVRSFGTDSTPHHATALLGMLKYSRVIIILDEFDRITDPELQGKISSLLKLVSDARIPARFVLVGGESAFLDIVKGHASLMRHVTQVSTRPLGNDAIFELLDRCAQRCELEFSIPSKRLIDAAACGSPYHTRLFGMHAALAALHGSASEISTQHVLNGFERAFDEWALLNEQVAGTFREICDGQHGDPAPYVEFAERMAKTGIDHSRANNGVGDHEPDASIPLAFGSAIQLSDDYFTFRDATAPQFLIALHRTRNRISFSKESRNA